MNDSFKGSAHPSMEKLRTFGLGQLEGAEASVIEEHVSHCEPCCRTLAGVGPDTLIDLLRVARHSPLGDGATIALPEGIASGRINRFAAEGKTSAGAPAEPDVPALPPELRQHPRYHVLSLLGAGGMGSVYKAEHRLMNRRVAVKVMSQALVGSAAGVDRFRREVRAAAQLSHANIVTAHDAEQAGDVHFLVMEYVEGIDLARWVAAHGPLPAAEASDYVRQAAAGLQHAHENGMIHRDIKPHNLMRTQAGVVKILDFGLARLAAETGALPSGTTAQGTVLGTVDYMAPEQANDAHQADIRSDIYSLGCTLYHLLSGRPPFPHGTLVQKIMAHTERQPQALLEIRPELPPGLARVVERMMGKLPERRYQTPAEVCAALEPFARAAVVAVAELPALQSPRLPGRPADGGRTERLPSPKHRPPHEEVDPDALAVRSRPRRRWPIALAVLLPLLLGALIAGGIAVYRIQTDYGELVITTDNPDVEVIIKQNGKVVRIIDTKTGKEVKLDSGRYELELKGKAEGLKLSPAKFTIRRGETVIARVDRLPKQVVVRQAEPPAEILRDAFNGSDNRPAHIYRVIFSPNGRYFLAGGDAGSRSPVRIYHGKKGQLISQLVPDEDLAWSGASFSSDGTKVVSWGSGSAMLYVWESATGKQLLKLEGHKEADCTASFSPDGKRIVSGSADKTLRIWDAATGNELHKLEGHTDLCAGVFSPDGKLILSFSPDNTLRAWDSQTGKQAWKQAGQVPPDDVPSIPYHSVFSPDGTQLFSFGADGGIRIWETGTGKTVRELKGNADTQRALFLHGGRQLVSWGKDKTLRFWDVASAKAVRSLELGETLQGEPDNVAISPDGRLLLTGHMDRTVRVRDLATGKELHRYAQVPQTGTRSLAFSPDSRFAAAGSARGWVYLWRLPAPLPPLSDKVGAVRRFHWGSPSVQSAAFSPNGVWAAAGDNEGALRLCDLRTGKEVRRLPAHTGMVYGVAFSPDGSKVVSAGTNDKLLRLSDVATGKELRRFEGHEHAPVRIALSADGRQRVCGDWGGGLRSWDVESGKEIQSFQGHTDIVHALAFAPDGKTVASGSRDTTIRFWDLKTGKEVHRIDANADCVTGVAFAPDGKQLLSSHFDGTLRWWDVATGKEVRRFAVQTDTIQSMALSPDGRFALTGGGADITNKGWKKGTDFTVRLWDVVAGKEVQRFEGHQDIVTWVTLSHDGRHGLSCSSDGSMRLWCLPKAAPKK